MKKNIIMSLVALIAISFGVQAFAQEDKVSAPSEQETQEEGKTSDEDSQEETLVSSENR
jgi:hypothetical protein